jgi:hypothetical protein
MSSLIILGNTNRFTFANSIDSQKELAAQIDWLEYLEKNNISRELLTQSESCN